MIRENMGTLIILACIAALLIHMKSVSLVNENLFEILADSGLAFGRFEDFPH